MSARENLPSTDRDEQPPTDPLHETAPDAVESNAASALSSEVNPTDRQQEDEPFESGTTLSITAVTPKDESEDAAQASYDPDFDGDATVQTRVVDLDLEPKVADPTRPDDHDSADVMELPIHRPDQNVSQRPSKPTGFRSWLKGLFSRPDDDDPEPPGQTEHFLRRGVRVPLVRTAAVSAEQHQLDGALSSDAVDRASHAADRDDHDSYDEDGSDAADSDDYGSDVAVSAEHRTDGEHYDGDVAVSDEYRRTDEHGDDYGNHVAVSDDFSGREDRGSDGPSSVDTDAQRRDRAGFDLTRAEPAKPVSAAVAMTASALLASASAPSSSGLGDDATSDLRRQRDELVAQLAEVNATVRNHESQLVGQRRESDQVLELVRAQAKAQEQDLVATLMALRQSNDALDEAEERIERRFREQVAADRAKYADQAEVLTQRALQAEAEASSARALAHDIQSRSAEEMTTTVTRLDALTLDLEAAGGELERATKRERGLTTSLESTRGELLRERAQSQRSVADLTARLEVASREQESLSAAVSKRAARAAELETQLAERDERIRSGTEQIARFRQLLADNQMEVKRTRDKLTAVEAELSDTGGVARRRELENRELQDNMRTLLQEKDEREKEYVSVRSRLETQFNDIRTNLADRDRRVAFLQDSVEKSEMRGLELEDQLQETTRKLESLREQATQHLARKDQEHRAVVASHDAKLVELRRLSTELHERDAARAEEVERLEARIREKDTQVNELLQLMDSRSAALTKTEASLAQANDRHDQLLKKHSTLTLRAQQLGDALDERGDQIRALEEQQKRAEQTRLQAEARQALLSRELEARSERVATLEASLKDAEAIRRGLEQRAQSLAQSLEEQLGALTRELEESQDTAHQLGRQLDDATTVRTGLEQRVRTLTVDLGARSERVASVEMALFEAKGQREALLRILLEGADADETEFFQAMLHGESEPQSRIDDVRLKRGHKQRALHSSILERDRELTDLRTELSRQRDGLSERNHELATLRDELQRRDLGIAERDQELIQRREHDDQLRTELSALRRTSTDLGDELAARDQRLGAREGELNDLRDELRKLEQRHEAELAQVAAQHEASRPFEQTMELAMDSTARGGSSPWRAFSVLLIAGLAGATAAARFGLWNPSQFLGSSATTSQARDLSALADLTLPTNQQIQRAQEFVRAWSSAIEQRPIGPKDWQKFLDLHESNFVPDGTATRRAFEDELKETLRTADWLAVSLDALQVRQATAGQIVATFPMELRAGGILTKGRRQLWLAEDARGNLRIRADRWVP